MARLKCSRALREPKSTSQSSGHSPDPKKCTRPCWPSAEVLRSSLTVGVPGGVAALLSSSAFVVIGLALAHVGAAHLAAHEVVLNITSVSFLPGFGIGEASDHLGRGRAIPHRARSKSRQRLPAQITWVGGVAIKNNDRHG